MEVLVVAILMVMAPSVGKFVDSLAYRTKAEGQAEIIRAKSVVSRGAAQDAAALARHGKRRGGQG
ncbi:hypothetical protein [Streptomyces sp. NPDC017991]|uniref:hypothetical protein n=1 Tax=Streptomyces sp. NPDC017991 TaxID=3365026 RepID=UPI0037B591EC